MDEEAPILEPINDTQQRILDATIDCVKTWGVEKTSLNDQSSQCPFQIRHSILKMFQYIHPQVYRKPNYIQLEKKLMNKWQIFLCFSLQ